MPNPTLFSWYNFTMNKRDQPVALTEKETEYKIGSLTLSFKEFIYGFETLKTLAAIDETSKHIILFYHNAIYQYICAHFLLKDKLAFKVLKEVKKEFLLLEIQKILQTTISNTTFGEIIRQKRNKTFVHDTYSSSYAGDVVRSFNPFNMLKEADCMRKLNKAIINLHDELMKLLPKDKGY